MVVAATGSVGETMAPSTNAAGHDMPSTRKCAVAATATVVTRTRPTASSDIGGRLSRRSRREEKNAAE